MTCLDPPGTMGRATTGGEDVFQRPRGTADILPGQAERWTYVEGLARTAAARHGFAEIRTPLIESAELFVRGVGEGTDVVSKEMYVFADRGGRQLALRPEGTAAVARALVENRLLGGLVKVFYLQPNFRYERPEAGRYRQHHQFGAEIFGAADPLADAEVLSLATAFLDSVGLGGRLVVRLNSIGCPTCRSGYRQALVAYLRPHREELCPTCQERMERSPLRVLDCKVPGCREVARGAPALPDYLCEDCRAHFAEVQGYTSALGIPYVLDATLVRGLDYYTRTVFEIQYEGLGAQSTVCAGGRYDGLVEAVGGPPTPAVGFGLGLERLLLVLEREGVLPPARPPVVGYVAVVEAAQRALGLRLAREVRAAGVPVDLDLSGRSVGSQLRQADRCGARVVLLIGPQESAAGVVTVRDMVTGVQEQVPFPEVPARVRQLAAELPATDGRQGDGGEPS